jgi:N-acetylglutamate synthase-like GNAT family acetyltransferase
MNATFRIRRAREADEYAITALVRSERLNPIDLDWRRFVLAIDEKGIAGAVQLRLHDDDSRELGSLVVRHDARGRGVGARLIDALLAPVTTRVCMITGARFAHHYLRWGFRRIDPGAAPSAVRRNFYFGRFVGGALAFLAGREPRALAILDRPAAKAA